MKTLLDLKFRKFHQALERSGVTALGEETSTYEEKLRASFHAGAHAQRELLEDDEQSEIVTRLKCRAELTTAERGSWLILGIGLGVIVSLLMALLVIRPH
jgi:hypothetical protein